MVKPKLSQAKAGELMLNQLSRQSSGLALAVMGLSDLYLHTVIEWVQWAFEVASDERRNPDLIFSYTGPGDSVG